MIYIDVRPKKGSADPRINDLGLTPPEYINPALGNAWTKVPPPSRIYQLRRGICTAGNLLCEHLALAPGEDFAFAIDTAKNPCEQQWPQAAPSKRELWPGHADVLKPISLHKHTLWAHSFARSR